MDIIKIAAVIVLAVVIVSATPAFDKSVSAIIRLCICVVIMLYITSCITDVINSIRILTDEYISSDFAVIYKALGISIITVFVSDIAADSGNKALSNRMIFAGKAAIILLAMPVFIQVLEIIKRFTE